MTVSDAVQPVIESKVLRRDGIVSNRGAAPGAGDGSWCGLFPEATVMMSRKNPGAALLQGGRRLPGVVFFVSEQEYENRLTTNIGK